MRQRVTEIGKPPPDDETAKRAGHKGDPDTTDDGTKEEIVKHPRATFTTAIAGVLDPPIKQMFVVVPMLVECQCRRRPITEQKPEFGARCHA